MALFSLEDGFWLRLCNRRNQAFTILFGKKGPFLVFQKGSGSLGRGGPQGLRALTRPGFSEEAQDRGGERTSPGEIYQKGSWALTKRPAPDSRSSMVELELSGELAHLLE